MLHAAFARAFSFAVLLAAALLDGDIGVRAHAVGTVAFVGSTPCDLGPRQFLGIPSEAACERISWELLLTSSAGGGTGKYGLQAVYGMQARNDPGFVNGGTAVRAQGTWTIRKGRAGASDADVYRLAADTAGRTLDFVRLGENLVHPLNDRGALMVGNAGWSYTLSRRPPNAERSMADATLESVAGTQTAVFEGRTPCQEIVRLLNAPRGGECTKMKWRVTLTPNSYKLESSMQRNPPRTGTWRIRRGAPDFGTTVYDLDPQPNGAFLSFLKVDDNHLFFLDRQGGLLVGDAYYSYTLSRTK